MLPVIYFNSTMVRLKAAAGATMNPTQLFQFHYGTIKSAHTFQYCSPFALFQFHYGTIKRMR